MKFSQNKKKVSIADLSPSEVKPKVEAILKDMEARAELCGDPDISIVEIIGRFRMSVMILTFCSVLGTSILLAGGLYYLSIPPPLVYATTQNGDIFPIKNIRRDK